MMKRSDLYNWIAETARLIPGATFHPPKLSYRDGRTRILVEWNENEQTFVISTHSNRPEHAPATPQDVAEHFQREDL